MSIKHVQTLMYNPFFMRKVIQSFLTGYGSEVDIKMLFYVLPIVMYKDSREILNGARSDSTIYSIFTKKKNFHKYNAKMNTKFCLNRITEMFNDYIEVTKQAIIILSNENEIIVDKKIKLLKPFNYKNSPSLIRDYFKASHYLGRIMKKSSISEFEKIILMK